MSNYSYRWLPFFVLTWTSFCSHQPFETIVLEAKRDNFYIYSVILHDQVFSPWIPAACSQHPCWPPCTQSSHFPPWAITAHPNKAAGDSPVNSQYGWKYKEKCSKRLASKGSHECIIEVKSVLSNLWNSSVRSSPSARLIKQCLRRAPKCLYSTASSFSHTHTPHAHTLSVQKSALISLAQCFCSNRKLLSGSPCLAQCNITMTNQ